MNRDIMKKKNIYLDNTLTHLSAEVEGSETIFLSTLSRFFSSSVWLHNVDGELQPLLAKSILDLLNTSLTSYGLRSPSF